MANKDNKVDASLWVIAVGAGAIMSALWGLPKLAVPASVHRAAERFIMEDRARQTWAGVVGGSFFLITAYFTWRTVKASERSLELTQENLKLIGVTQLSQFSE